MGRPSRFSPEVRERAVRMVEEHRATHASEWGVLQSVAPKLGCTAETLRKWVRQAQRDAGYRPGLTTSERERLKELARPASPNFLHQQARFDEFLERYNQERPHQALDMKVPGELYTPSLRPYRGLGELDYPFHDWTATVTHCGRICFNRRKVNLSQVFAGQKVGVKQVSDQIWLVSFMNYDLGYFDEETCRLEPIENPFSPKVLPMSPE